MLGFSSGSRTMAKSTSNFFTSSSNAFLGSLFINAVFTSLVCFLKLGDNFKHCMIPLKNKKVFYFKKPWNQITIPSLNILTFSKWEVRFKYLANLLSPTIKMGWWALKETWFNRAFFLGTTGCVQIGWYLSTFKSKTCTFPSTVTAANTVLE